MSDSQALIRLVYGFARTGVPVNAKLMLLRTETFGSSGMDGFSGIAAFSLGGGRMTTNGKSSVGARSVAPQAQQGFAPGFRV